MIATLDSIDAAYSAQQQHKVLSNQLRSSSACAHVNYQIKHLLNSCEKHELLASTSVVHVDNADAGAGT